jgi:hypothetical protein
VNKYRLIKNHGYINTNTSVGKSGYAYKLETTVVVGFAVR